MKQPTVEVARYATIHKQQKNLVKTNDGTVEAKKI